MRRFDAILPVADTVLVKYERARLISSPCARLHLMAPIPRTPSGGGG